MKKILILIISLFLFSCGTKKNTFEETKPLFEVMAEKSDGGAKIQFYEIISESKEFSMIKNDPDLKGKIKPDDILTSNFAILNLGEKKQCWLFVKNCKSRRDKPKRYFDPQRNHSRKSSNYSRCIQIPFLFD